MRRSHEKLSEKGEFYSACPAVQRHIRDRSTVVMDEVLDEAVREFSPQRMADVEPNFGIANAPSLVELVDEEILDSGLGEICFQRRYELIGLFAATFGP
jgi:hypothetical protein